MNKSGQASKQRKTLELRAATADLRRYPVEATIIIRLGAVANAMQAAVGGHDFKSTSLASLRDRVYVTALMASLAREAARIANEEAAQTIVWSLAAKGLSPRSTLPTMTLDELRALLKPESAFMVSCSTVRDSYNFHVDERPVKKWLDAQDSGSAIILQTIEEKSFASCLFDASARLLRSSLPAAADDPQFAHTLVRLSVDLPSFVGVLIEGLGRLPDVKLRPRDAPEKPNWKIGTLLLDPSQHRGATVAVEVNSGDRQWSPFFAAIPSIEVGKVRPQLFFGSSRRDASSWKLAEAPATESYPGWWVRLSLEPARPGDEHHMLVCAEMPSAIVFGQVNGEQHNMILTKQWSPRSMKLPSPPKVRA